MTPPIHSRALDLPTGLLVVAHPTMGLRSGSLGVALAAPLCAVALVAARPGYVRSWVELLVFGIRTGSVLYFEAALVIAPLGFVSTAALSKFLMRGEVIE